MTVPIPADDRLIVAIDRPDAISGLKLAETLGDAVSFYKIGLGMLTGGGLALARELKDEHGKRIFLDMKLFDIGATVEAAVRGLAQFDLDFLTVHGDPHVVRAAREGAGGKEMKILAVTILTSLVRDDLDEGMMRAGDVTQMVVERAGRALEAGADGVIASPQEAALIRALPQAIPLSLEIRSKIYRDRFPGATDRAKAVRSASLAYLKQNRIFVR